MHCAILLIADRVARVAQLRHAHTMLRIMFITLYLTNAEVQGLQATQQTAYACQDHFKRELMFKSQKTINANTMDF